MFVALFFISGLGQVIEIGSNIKVSVNGYPELTRIYTVSENGVVNISHIGQIPVIGLDLADLTSLITESYKKIYPQAIITVETTEEKEIEYEIYGAVAKPGKMKGSNYTSLQTGMIEAGGELEKMDLNKIMLIRNNKKTNYNMNEFLRTGDMSFNPKLKDGDIIFVPLSTKESSIQVFGSVNKQGFVNYKEGISLLEAVSLCGGFSEHADLERILLIRYINDYQIEEVINLKKIIEKRLFQQIPEIKPGDLILVKEKKHRIKTLLSYLDSFSREILVIISIILAIDNMDRK